MSGHSSALNLPPFVVMALPRSRTRWLASFLSYRHVFCGHEEIRHCRSLDDVRSWLSQPHTGTVETAAAPFWRLLRAYCPQARVVVVHRPVADVVASLRRSGLDFSDDEMAASLEGHELKLRQIEARWPGVMSVQYDELANEAVCARVFEHCLGMEHDHAWWERLAGLNLQVSVPHMYRYFMAHQPQVEKLRRMARHEMLRMLRPPTELNGVTFQQEPLAQLLGDGAGLLDDECVAGGEYPEAWRNLNLPLLERLEASGSLHIYTARSNGRMFGYAAYAVGECFYAAGQLEAEHVVFFADAGWPTLGRKLQHHAIGDLRAKGVDRVMMFQPDSTRVGLLYRRLGAQQTGTRYVMELN